MRVSRSLWFACLLAATVLIGAVPAAGAATLDGVPEVTPGAPVTIELPAGGTRYLRLPLGLAERVAITTTGGAEAQVTTKVFRPAYAADDALAAVANTESSGDPARATMTADVSGSWVVRVDTDSATTATLLVETLAASPGPGSGAPLIDYAPGVVRGATVYGTTYSSRGLTPRYWTADVKQGDRITVTLSSTNGQPVSLEAFRPGMTDDRVAAAKPARTWTTTTSESESLVASLTGSWVVRASSTASAPATFAIRIDTTPIPEPACRSEITDIGLVRVKGCIEKRGDRYAFDETVSFSTFQFVPLNGATVFVDPKTLEVTSPGKFDVIWESMQILSATDDFQFEGEHTFSVPDDTVFKGLPVTGSLRVAWSARNGGQAEVTGTVALAALGVTGTLEVLASNDRGLQRARIAVAAKGVAGVVDLDGEFGYREEETADGRVIDVWKFEASAAVGVAPAALTGGRGGLTIRDGKLTSFVIGVNTAVPLGSTGIVLSYAGLNLSLSPHIEVEGRADLTLAGIPAAKIEGRLGYSAVGSCQGSMYEGDRWYAEGTAVFLGAVKFGRLGLCYQGVERPFVTLYGDTKLDIPNVLTGKVRLAGYIDGARAVTAEGEASLVIYGFRADGYVVVSDHGIAACASTTLSWFGAKRDVAFGGEYAWDGSGGKAGFRCPDFAPYRTAMVRTRQGAASWPVQIRSGMTEFTAHVQGANGIVPAVDVVGPDGTVVARSTSTTAPTKVNGLFLPDPATGGMLIAIPVARTGTYTVVARDGSAIEKVEFAVPRPKVVVKGAVASSGDGSTLTYSTNGLDGRSVEFWELGGQIARRLATTSAARGTIRFVPSPGLARARSVSAIVVDDDGTAQPAQAVTTFRGPLVGAPSVPQGIALRRAGSRVRVDWTRGTSVRAWRVVARLSDGTRISRVVRQPRLAIAVPRGVGVTVRVTASGYANRTAAAAPVRLTARQFATR